MTGSDMQTIERALGLPLPEFYGRSMLTYPPSL
jgi:hypothetical protein